MWRDELGKMLEERVADAMQDYRRATGSNIDDAKLLKAQRALDLAEMRLSCYRDERCYDSGSGSNSDYSKSFADAGSENMDDKRKAPHLDYRGNKWNVKRYG